MARHDADIVRQLQEEARRLGLDMLSVVPADPAPHLAAYEQWVAGNFQGEMSYLARPDRLRRRRDLRAILPDVQRIIVVVLNYYTVSPPLSLLRDPSRGRISNYAWGNDYHEVLLDKLERLGRFLKHRVGESLHSKAYVDTGAILERDHAWLAGLGFVGKNSCLINPRLGSYFFLGELLVNVPLPVSKHLPLPNRCGRCRRCLDACPTGALTEERWLDSRRCISYLTIELKGPIPRELRPLMGNWIYGCDICQEVCPWQRFKQPTAERAFYPANDDQIAPSLLKLISLDANDFRQRYLNSPILRLKRGRFLRNVAVAIGNWGNPEAIPALLPRLEDQESLVRGHVAWALGRIGTAAARQALRTHLSREKDAWVRKEIVLALSTTQAKSHSTDRVDRVIS